MKKNFLSALVIASLAMSMFAQNAKATTFGDLVKGTTGTIFAFPVGTVVGGLRGGVVGAVKGTQATAEAFGNKNGILHNVIGAPTGGVAGLVWGGTSGIVMGAYDGIRYGWSEPWQKNSFSAGGNDLLDYDPFFDWNDWNWDDK